MFWTRFRRRNKRQIDLALGGVGELGLRPGAAAARGVRKVLGERFAQQQRLGRLGRHAHRHRDQPQRQPQPHRAACGTWFKV